MLINLLPTRRRRRSSQRTGATAVEFAMVAPSFFIVIAICFEFARLSTLRNLSQNAGYEACRFVITEGATIADGIGQAQNVLDRVGRVDADILVNGNDGSADDQGNVIGEIGPNTRTVACRIQIPMAGNTWFIPGTFFGDRMIESTTTLRTERFEGFFNAREVDGVN